MPLPGKRWYHATFSTHNSWLPGDPRGFRSRKHKLHSSGDHRNPPPIGEHAGLHAYSKSISEQALVLDPGCRAIVGNAVLGNLKKHQRKCLVIAAGGMHVHTLVELSANSKEAKQAIGYAKLSASMSLNPQIPGRVWARGCNVRPIRDEEHHRNTFGYIERHREEGAWVWTFRDAGAEGL